METNIEQLNVEIIDNSTVAAQGLDNLCASLKRLKTASSNNSGMGELVSKLEEIRSSVDNMPTSKLTGFAQALKDLGKVKVNNLKGAADQIKSINDVVNTMQGMDFSVISTLSSSLSSLSAIPKADGLRTAVTQLNSLKTLIPELNAMPELDRTKIDTLINTLSLLSGLDKAANFGYILNQLKKLPGIAAELNNFDVSSFSVKINELAVAMRPLADEMDKIYKGFSSFPSRLQTLIANYSSAKTATNSFTSSLRNLSSALSSLQKIVGVYAIYTVFRRVQSFVSYFFVESANYIEALNLFNVTMKDGTAAALAYAESLEKLLGIDLKEWMTYQGQFQNLVTGYNVATDSSTIMSKNLAQLSYDLSSVFNVEVETAFQKLQSAMSGQIKGLKVWGVDVSVASMKQYMLAKGIDATWISLNTAQQAMLRYNYIMEKTVSLQGDLSRTLLTPANSIRIFTTQVTKLRRAIGDIISILAIKVIPYFQAFVELSTESANELAEAWGFEIAPIDYSNLDMTSLTEETEEYNDEISKLKKNLLGIDEINVLGNTSIANTGVGSLDNLGLPLYDYDFATNAFKIPQEVYDEVRGFVNFLKDSIVFIKDNAKEIFYTFVAIAAINFTSKLITAGSSIVTASKMIYTSASGKISNILQSFDSGYMSGGLGAGFSQVFKDGTKGIRNYITEMKNGEHQIAKFAIGLTAIAAGAALAASGGKKLADALSSDSKDGLGGAFVSLVSGGALSVFGGFMVGGPIGAVIGGLVAVGSAAITFIEQNKKLRAELNNDIFFEDYGRNFSELKNDMEKSFASVDEYTNKQSLLTEKITSSATAANEAKDKLSVYFAMFNERQELSTDDIDEMTTAINDLYTAVDEMTSARFESVFVNIGKAIVNGLAPGLAALTDMSAEMTALQAAFKTDYTSLQTEATSILEQLGSSTLDDSMRSKLMSRLQEIQTDMSVYTYSVNGEDKQRDDKISGINIGSNISEAISNLQGLRSSLDTRVEAISSTKYEGLANLEALQHIADVRGIETGIDWKAAAEATEANAQAQMQEVLASYIDKLKQIYLELYKRSETVYKSLVEEYSKNAGWKTLFAGNPIWLADRAEAEVKSQFGAAWAALVDEVKWVEQIGQNNNLSSPILSVLQKQLKNSPYVAGYATGGFPEDGFFFANHNELVGGFSNGKTAVANNGQIIEGIKQGVKEAIRESGSMGSGGTVIIQVMDVNGNVKSESYVTEAELRNRRDGKIVIPVGV